MSHGERRMRPTVPVALAVTVAVAASLPPAPIRAQPAPPGDGIDPNARAAAASIPFIPEALVDELARRIEGQRRASERVTNPVLAIPVNRSVNVNLGPGGTTPIVQTVMGYPTSIAFLDADGQPWPIHWDVNSNPAIPAASAPPGATAAPAGAVAGVGPAVSYGTGFEVDVPVKGGNVLNITTRSPGPRGGLTVMLEGANAPLAFLLMGNDKGDRRFDSRLAAMVAGRGPNARARPAGAGFAGPGVPVTGAAHLTSMLDGVAPAAAVPLGVSGMSPDDIRAWRLGDKAYLRTRVRVVSPQPVATARGLDGVTIYEIPAVPIVLVSSGGQTLSIRFQER